MRMKTDHKHDESKWCSGETDESEDGGVASLSCRAFKLWRENFFTKSDLEENMNCSALILSHLVLHLLPSPDPLFSKISRYQDSGKHCPEMTILIAHASVNFTLFTIHIRLVGNMKRGGSK